MANLHGPSAYALGETGERLTDIHRVYNSVHLTTKRNRCSMVGIQMGHEFLQDLPFLKSPSLYHSLKIPCHQSSNLVLLSPWPYSRTMSNCPWPIIYLYCWHLSFQIHYTNHIKICLLGEFSFSTALYNEEDCSAIAIHSWICCLVAQSCLTLCDPMDCSMPDFSVLHHLPVCSNSRPLNLWCHPTISSSPTSFSSCSQSFPASRSFLMSQLITWGGQSIWASASESVLPMNSQDWFPLGWTGWISLKSKGLSRVFSNTTVQKHQFFSTQPSLWSNSQPYMTTGPLTRWTFVGK